MVVGTKKVSFVNRMNLLMGIQMATVSILLILFVVSIYRAAEEDTEIAGKNILNVYAMQMENRIRKVETQLTTIINENLDLQLLESEDEMEGYYASLRLSGFIKEIMSIDQSADIFVITEAEHNICIDAKTDNLTFDEKENIRQMFMNYVQSGQQTENWKFQKIGDTFYLYRAIVRGGRVVAAAISADSLLKTLPIKEVDVYSFVLTDSMGMVKAYAGNQSHGLEINTNIQKLQTGRHITNAKELLDGQVRLYSFESKSYVLKHLYRNTVFLLIIIVLLCIFDFYFMRMERRQIVVPMNVMVQDMERISSGNYGLRVMERGNTLEFSLLSQTFNRLMDEIVNLKIRFYEKQLALSDAEQKYIRLQIRPHFFLNAMTTISGLSAQNKNVEIEKYISALSKNIRYMFSSGLHTVPVKEEIQHVENYFEMQEMRYPDCIFYFIEMPPELENWNIPQMLIHTLVENEYKYGISQETSLMVLIKVSAVMNDGEKMLLIEVEDDGKGYPQEVIDNMNRDSVQDRRDGMRVGLWSVKRLMELMYDRKNLFRISNVAPHGALNQIYVPAAPINERGKEYLDEQGIQ